MRFKSASVVLLAIFGIPVAAWGHGFNLSVNSYSNPTAFSITSAQPVLDNTDNPTPGSANIFCDAFEDTPNADGSHGTVEGFAQTSGPFPNYSGATFNVISPLYYSNGLSPAAPASAGTQLHIYDLWAGDPDPLANPHPGASAGDLYLKGSTSFYAGFGVSLYDFHELEKDLYVAADSTQTYGEYGFAFDVTVPFANGTTLTTGPLVDVFALADSGFGGGDFTDAPLEQQDAATLGIYNAVVPEPATWTLLAIGGAVLATAIARRRLNRRLIV